MFQLFLVLKLDKSKEVKEKNEEINNLKAEKIKNNKEIIDLPEEDIYFKNLLEKLLKKNPNERINWNEYFNHPFFLDNKHINIIVLGKKNVGKSTLIKNVLDDKSEKKKFEADKAIEFNELKQKALLVQKIISSIKNISLI